MDNSEQQSLIKELQSSNVPPRVECFLDAQQANIACLKNATTEEEKMACNTAYTAALKKCSEL